MSTSIPLRYWVDVAGRTFEVREVEGEERLSTPFRIELRFPLATGGPLDPHEIVRTPIGRGALD